MAFTKFISITASVDTGIPERTFLPFAKCMWFLVILLRPPPTMIELRYLCSVPWITNSYSSPSEIGASKSSVFIDLIVCPWVALNFVLSFEYS